MIRNIIFDVGNVLTLWNTEELARRLFPDNPRKARFVLENGFNSPLWFQGDRGTTTMTDLAAQMAAGSDDELKEAMLYAMTHFSDVVIPMPETIAFLKEMKQRGYGIYLLSNYNEYFEDSIRTIGILPYLDGYVYSYKEKVIKPDPLIYQILLNRYQLKKEECLFIDDKPSNVQGALQVGFGYGFVFENNVEELRAYVEKNS